MPKASKSGKIELSLGTFLLVLVIILGAAWYMGYLNIPGSITTPPGGVGTTPGPSDMVVVNKPLQFSAMDPLAGQALGGATIAIYAPDKTLKESITTDSSTYIGRGVTINPYKSGDTIYVKLSKTGYVTRWIPVTIPKMTYSDAQSLQYNFIPLQTYNLGTYSIKVIDQFGNTYSSGGTVNFTALGANQITLTINIYNTEDNSGYISSHDLLNNIDLKACLLTSTTGSSVTVSGFGSSIQRGTTTYWTSVVADDALTRQLVGNQYVKPGVATVTITVGKGSLTVGSSQAFTLSLMGYFDPMYFAQNGIGGPDATQLATFTLNVAA